MGISSKTLRLYIGCALILSLNDFSYSGERALSEFDYQYQPTPRELCEMLSSSIHQTTNYIHCKDVETFKPVILKNILDDQNMRVMVTKEEFPDWKFPDVYFQIIQNAQGVEEWIFNIEGAGQFGLKGLLYPNPRIEDVAIGNISDVIILELRSNDHVQIIFTPHSCKGYDGYGDEVLYTFSQSFNWSPNFAPQLYRKQFFSPPLCN